MPKITISILAYGAVDHSRACLQSVIENSGGHDLEIILTDNGSTDGTAELFETFQRRFPDGVVKIVTNPANEGFIAPNRWALDKASGEYFVMLNNDARVPPGWLDQLLAPFLKHPRAALTGPEGSCCELTKDFSGIPGRIVDYLEGSCLCGRADILRRHGLFSDYLHFAYHEDSDLSLRMQEMGYTIHRVPFRIQHAREATSKTVPNIQQYQEANRKVMIDRWSGWRRARRFNYPIVVRRRASAGDVLLVSSVVKALSERCPRAMIMVETDFKAVFTGNPRVLRTSSRFPNYKVGRLIDLDMAYEDRPGKHIISAYADVAHLGPLELRTEFYESRVCTDNARKALADGTWIAIHAGPTTWEGKNWPEARWKELVLRLASEGWKILLVGNQGYDLSSHLDLRGKTRVHELAGYLRACSLFCGVDSFPMHLAQAVGTPVVPLFGVTSPEFILTLGSAAYPVQSDPEHEFTGIRHKVKGVTHVPVDRNPMETIELEQVLETIEVLQSPAEALASA